MTGLATGGLGGGTIGVGSGGTGLSMTNKRFRRDTAANALLARITTPGPGTLVFIDDFGGRIKLDGTNVLAATVLNAVAKGTGKVRWTSTDGRREVAETFDLEVWTDVVEVMVTTQAQLNAAVAAATGGERILVTPLAGGALYTLSITNRAFAQPITIVSASSSSKALFSGIAIVGSNGIVVQGVKIDSSATGKAASVGDLNIGAGCSNIVLDGNIILSRATAYDDGTVVVGYRGIRASAAVDGLVIRNNEIGYCSFGIQLQGGLTNSAIYSNFLHHNQYDDIQILGNTVATQIYNNDIFDFLGSTHAINHKDGIQLSNSGYTDVTHDVKIFGNVVHSRGGSKGQGIAVFNEANVEYYNIEIYDNFVCVNSFVGVRLDTARDSRVDNNFVICDINALHLDDTSDGYKAGSNIPPCIVSGTVGGAMYMRNNVTENLAEYPIVIAAGNVRLNRDPFSVRNVLRWALDVHRSNYNPRTEFRLPIDTVGGPSWAKLAGKTLPAPSVNPNPEMLTGFQRAAAGTTLGDGTYDLAIDYANTFTGYGVLAVAPADGRYRIAFETFDYQGGRFRIHKTSTITAAGVTATSSAIPPETIIQGNDIWSNTFDLVAGEMLVVKAISNDGTSVGNGRWQMKVRGTSLKRVGQVARVSSGNDFVAFGDSRVNTYTYAMASNVEQSALALHGGILTGLRQLLKGQIDFNRAATIGEGGRQTSYLNANYLANAVASSAKNAIIIMGTNNFRDGDPQSLQSSKDDLLKAINDLSAGPRSTGVVYFIDEWPKTVGTVVGAGIRADFMAYRDYARSLHDPANGRVCLRTWDVIATAPDGETPRAGLLRDEVHLTTAGVQAIARAVRAQLAQTLPAVDLTARAVKRQQVFSASGGTLAGATVTPTGVAPAGWTLSADAVASGTIASEIDTTNNIWRIILQNVANGAANAALSIRGPTDWGITDFVLGTDRVDMTIFSKVLAGSVNLGNLSMKLRRNGGQFTPSLSDPAADASFAGSASSKILAFDANEWDAQLRLPHVLTVSGATQSYFWIDITGFKTTDGGTTTSDPISAVIELKLPQIGVYTGTITD